MSNPKYPLPGQIDRAQQFELEFMRPDPLMTPDEIYSSVTHQLLKRLEEDRRIERKPAGIHANALGDYFSLWANTVPDGGIIALGIEDNGSITGCSHLTTTRLNDLERAGAVYCPEARYECKRIPAVNSSGKMDFLLIFRIYYHDSKVVETVSGDAFTRLGESRKKLSAEEVRELQIDKGQTDLEQEPSRLAYPEQFDADLIRRFADGVRLMGHLGSHTDEEILEHRRLGKRQGTKFIANIACALLFSNDPVVEFPGCKIRFLRFDGEWEGTGERFNAVKDRWIEGCVPSLVTGHNISPLSSRILSR